MPKRWGLSLGNVILVVTLLAVLAFAVAALSLQHLNFSNRIVNSHEALRAAESTIALALKELFVNGHYGEIRQPWNSVEYRNPQGAVGQLSFYPPQAAEWSLDPSTNNLTGSNPVEGYDPARPVPAAATQLVAVGRYRGVTRRLEAVLYLPPFPYAIASAGPLRSQGGLEVGALGKGGEVTDLSLIHTEDLVGAHIVTNSRQDQALFLGADSLVIGDVRAQGGIVLDPKAVVRGEVRGNSSAINLPKESVTGYDPQLLGKPNLQIIAPGQVKAPFYEGFVRSGGDLTVSEGLVLENSVLYVDGNLSVDGGVRGSGALFVTGNTHLTGYAELASDNSVALMSQGNVTLESSSFQGMIYTEGDFRAHHIQLLGVFIQNGPAHEVEINHSRLISVPDLSRMKVRVNSPAGSLARGNLFLNRDGDAYPARLRYGDHGPIVFEAYPLSNGGWELADPNSNTVHRLPDYTALRAKFVELWNDYAARRNSRDDHLLGLDDKGRTQHYNIRSADSARLGAALDAQLAGLATREPGASALVAPGATSEVLDLDPSRFLSYKDRMRVLYWRSQ